MAGWLSDRILAGSAPPDRPSRISSRTRIGRTAPIGRVGIELGVMGNARGTTASAALVKQDDAKRTRIEPASHAGRAT